MRLPEQDGDAAASPDVGRVDRTRGARYLLVGAFNTAFGYGLFVLLQLTIGRNLHYIGVLLIAHVISVLVAFVLYRTVVFCVTGSVLRDLARFWSVYLVSIALNIAALPLLVETMEMDVLLAQALVLGFTVVGSYLAHSRFSFQRRVA